MWKAEVYVTYQAGIAEPQGLAVKEALQSLGFEDLQEVRIGKLIEIKLDDHNLSEENAHKKIKKMCTKLLANPVMESYHYTVAKVVS